MSRLQRTSLSISAIFCIVVMMKGALGGRAGYLPKFT